MTLELRSLEFAYDRSTPVISGLSLQLASRRMTAITGPSGSGKSTLLYLMSLLISPRSGAVLVNGKDTSTMSDSERASHRALDFGFVFQDAALDGTRSVLDNILETSLYRGTDRAQDRTEALRLMELLEVEVPPSSRPGLISGGQAQRIALCRALVGKPRFLFADEPTANLDATSASVVIQTLRRHAADGGLVVVATHDSRVVDRCDSVLEL